MVVTVVVMDIKDMGIWDTGISVTDTGIMADNVWLTSFEK
jgi:hypothetical protein